MGGGVISSVGMRIEVIVAWNLFHKMRIATANLLLEKKRALDHKTDQQTRLCFQIFRFYMSSEHFIACCLWQGE
jgi:hypothetical protein